MRIGRRPPGRMRSDRSGAVHEATDAMMGRPAYRGRRERPKLTRDEDVSPTSTCAEKTIGTRTRAPPRLSQLHS